MSSLSTLLEECLPFTFSSGENLENSSAAEPDLLFTPGEGPNQGYGTGNMTLSLNVYN